MIKVRPLEPLIVHSTKSGQASILEKLSSVCFKECFTIKTWRRGAGWWVGPSDSPLFLSRDSNLGLIIGFCVSIWKTQTCDVIHETTHLLSSFGVLCLQCRGIWGLLGIIFHKSRNGHRFLTCKWGAENMIYWKLSSTLMLLQWVSLWRIVQSLRCLQRRDNQGNHQALFCVNWQLYNHVETRILLQVKQLPCQKPIKHLISLISFFPSLTYLSILILTGLVGSQVIRLLQGMIWSGPLLYSQASSSAVIMLLCVSDLTVIILTQCLHRAGPGLRLAQCTGCGSGRAPQITNVVRFRFSSSRWPGPLTLECCHHWPLACGTLNHRPSD